MEWRQVGQTVNIDTEGVHPGRPQVSISHDGRRVVIGTTGAFNHGLRRVKVLVLDFDGESWNEVETFSGWNGDRFGYRIALSGNGKTLAIGAPGSSEGGIESGHVEAYHYEEGAGWKSKGSKLVGLQHDGGFGDSLALSEDGNHIAIGAPWNDENKRGCISVFYYDKDIFREVLQHAVDQFIKDRPVSVDWASIVAEFTGDGWIQMGATISGDADHDGGKIMSLSADGNIMAVGVSYDESKKNWIPASIQVFQYSSIRKTIKRREPLQRGSLYQQEGQWLQQNLHCGDSYDDYWRCYPSINAKGNINAVSICGGLGDYVRLFHFQNKEWQDISTTLRSQKMVCPTYISVSSNSLRIAVIIHDEEERHVEEGGFVRVYDYDENNWVQVGEIVAPFSEEYFSESISLSSHGDRLAVGSILNNGTNDYACVRIYQLS